MPILQANNFHCSQQFLIPTRVIILLELPLQLYCHLINKFPLLLDSFEALVFVHLHFVEAKSAKVKEL